MIHTIVQAAIFVQAGRPIDLDLAHQCIDHCRRRGYQLLEIFRDYDEALDAVESGEASVVVHVPAISGDSKMRMRNSSPDEERTRRLPRNVVPLSRRNAPPVKGMSAAEVRAVLDSDGPAPAGLDPEAIAAARRIAQHLTRCNQGRV